MRSVLCPLFVTTLVGCATASEATEGPTEAPAAPTASADVAVDTSGFHPAVANVAASAKNVDKFEFTLDENGAVIKQAVYHDDASAVAEVVKTKALEVFPGGTITHYETEWYADAGVVHEVEVRTADGQDCELSATPEGTVRYEECELDLASVPAPIASAIATAYPGGKILEVETKRGPGLDIVTAEVEVDGIEYYLRMTPSGSIDAAHKRVRAIVEIPVAVP